MQIKTTMTYHHTSTEMSFFFLTSTLNVNEYQSNRNSHSLLVGMQNSTASLEESLVISYKSEFTLRNTLLILFKGTINLIFL